MSQNLGLGIVLLLTIALSANAGQDTIPLSKKSVPAPSTESAEAPLNQKTNPAGKENPAGLPTPKGLQPYVASVDTYGSPNINESSLRQTLGKDLDTWIELGLKRDPKSLEWEDKLKEKVKTKWKFPYAEWSIVNYFEPGNAAIHITMDVVEAKDMARRMPFKPMPNGHFNDPDKLIQNWLEYEDVALELVEKGELEPPPPGDCIALHCPFGHKNAKLKKYEKIFGEGVRKNETTLVQIQQKEARRDWRAAATYLLAYIKDGKKVVNYMMDRVKDPDELVRNNALRVLGEIAEVHPEFVIPLKPMVECLDFPRVSDRSKAVYVMFQMASNSRQTRDEIMDGAVGEVLRLLDSKQPDHKEFAHGILRKISGKDFAATDLRAWKNWYAKLQSDRALANKKNQ